ncbi:MAG: CRTAC1 family protein, partial [Bacteroidetes bacterium]|nr:CRTAC1 family protein [Bacteroidota bacterium]
MTKILNCGSLFLIIIILGLFIFTGCNNPEQKLITEQESGNEDTTFLFTLLSAEESGISFYNELKENPKLNILTYEYLYNGSGVAIGDINNDNLPDIYLGGNLFGGRLFLNLGNMKFKQISDSSGTYVNGYSTGVCMIDINSDGLQDIYVCRSLSNNPELRTNVLFINNGDLTFTEKAAEYGINDRSFSNHANFFDYDNDGDLDMYLLNHRVDFKDALTLKKTKYKWGVEVPFIDTNYRYVSDRLYENTGNNKFKDITKKAGLLNKAYGLSVVCSDINQDGWIDIYVANDYADKDYLYINNGDGTFTDKVDDYLFHMSENSMGCDISDFNNDGLPDMITLDMMSGDNYRQKQLKGNSPYDQYHMAVDYGLSHQVMRNTLQLNNGNGTFSEIGQLAGVSHTDWSWAPIFADFDNDGYKDLFISNGYYRDVTDMDYIKYESNEIIQEAGGITKVNQLDLVNQMKITPVSNHIFQNNGDLTFSNKKNSWMNLPPSSSNGASFGDLDLDGDIDIIVNNLNSQAFIYENNASDNENNYLNIVLKGGKGNESGIGTKIYLSSKLGTQYIEATPYKGYLGSHHNIIHFGLGKDTLVDAKVIWLNGYSQELENIPVNKLLVVNQANADLLNVNFQKNIGLLESVDQNLLNEYVHVEDGFIDFKREPLLEHKISNKGPYISVADVNKDGNDDLFIGGSAGYPGKLYLQNSTGELILVNIDAFESDKKYEDCQSLFFDADNDNDL